MSRIRARKPIPLEFTSPETQSQGSNYDYLQQPPPDNGDDEFNGGTQEEVEDLNVNVDLALALKWDILAQPPGSHLQSTNLNNIWAPKSLTPLETFLSQYSSKPLLPRCSPTLSVHIINKVLSPLLDHAKKISSNLLEYYVDDLNLLDHFDILQAYFLGGDTAFSERVKNALFGKEAGAGEALGLGRRARTRARMGLTPAPKGSRYLTTRQPSHSSHHDRDDGKEDEGSWGIGLGLGLSERQQWPPGGAELAYALRTTIFDDSRRLDENDEHSVWEGIEDRLSFAVKDLPEKKDGKRAKWLDPQSIEALDFLYLSYSAPKTIRHLFPTSIMSKYQQIHNYLLRLSRLETVLQSIYFSSTHQASSFTTSLKYGVDTGSKPPILPPGEIRDVKALFPSYPKIQHLVQSLRFDMSVFISVLTKYILDAGIGANWTGMRRKLERLKRRRATTSMSRPVTPYSDGHPTSNISTPSSPSAGEATAEEDEEGGGDRLLQLNSIDSLLIYHNLVLDKILRSMLLSQTSTSQQTAQKMLTKLFSLILDFGKVVKQVELDHVEEDWAVERILAFAATWKHQKSEFMRVLERLSMRATPSAVEAGTAGGDTQDLELLFKDNSVDVERGHHRGDKQNDLAELLIRLELGSPELARRGKYNDTTSHHENV